MKRHHFFAVNGMFAFVAGLIGLSGIITTFDAMAFTQRVTASTEAASTEVKASKIMEPIVSAIVSVSPSEITLSTAPSGFWANIVLEVNSVPPQKSAVTNADGLKLSLVASAPFFGPQTCPIKVVHKDSGKIIGQGCPDFERAGDMYSVGNLSGARDVYIFFDKLLLLREEYPESLQIQISTEQTDPNTVVFLRAVAPLYVAPFDEL